MPITYGLNLSRSVDLQSLLRTSLMKSYTSHSEKSDVFLSYQHSDQAKALELAKYLDRQGREVFIDIYDDTLQPGDCHIDNALMTAKQPRSSAMPRQWPQPSTALRHSVHSGLRWLLPHLRATGGQDNRLLGREWVGRTPHRDHRAY